MFFHKTRMAREDLSSLDRLNAQRIYLQMWALTLQFTKELGAKHNVELAPVVSFDPEGRLVVKFVILTNSPGEVKAYESYCLWLTSDLYSGFAFQESVKDQPDDISKFHFSGSGMTPDMFIRAQVLQTVVTLNNLRRKLHMQPL